MVDVQASVALELEKGVRISFETGKLAKQADGAVYAMLGDTVVLLTAVAAKTVKEGTDFFPLTVDVEERMYAAGKIPGSFFRREGKASDEAILTCRLIDRPLRPCFPDGFRNEVHLVGTILSTDQKNAHDVLAINAASMALMISPIPFNGPVGAVRLMFDEHGQWVANPSFDDRANGLFEMVVAGRAVESGDVAIMMVEAGGIENSYKKVVETQKYVTELELLAGLEASKDEIRKLIRLQLELVEKIGGKQTSEFPLFEDYASDQYVELEAKYKSKISAAIQIVDKKERNKALDEIEAEAIAQCSESVESNSIKAALKGITKKLIRERIVQHGIRVDGRGVEDIRPLSAEVGLLPTTHGSGLFERGETQVLSVTTVAMPRMNQALDTLTTDESKRYMHHYNFPPFSTGETGFMRGPKRREIGHGLLAERALLPVIPDEKEFPYAIRVVSDVLSSNGSTSMASVCGSTLSLLDAGVPILDKVAGIAMGLINEGDTYVTLTDIQGAEDAYGDMDFKVAGTKDSVTALQLDTKIDGIPASVLAKALEQAKQARLKILEVMNSVINSPRVEMKPSAPRIVKFEIPLDKIGEVIGPKGKNINLLQQNLGVEINIDDDGVVGSVVIGAKDAQSANAAKEQILLTLNPPQPEIGKKYRGTIVGITKFGAFVNILPGRDGLVHISKFGEGRVKSLDNIVSVGQELEVVVKEIDSQGKVSLDLVEPVIEEVQPEIQKNDDEVEHISFEARFEAQLEKEIGQLGRNAE